MRTSFSLLLYEYKDFSVGVMAAEGQIICQGTGGTPVGEQRLKELSDP